MSFPMYSLLAVGAFTLSSLCLENSSSPPIEIITECISWCLILLSCKLYTGFDIKDPRAFSISELSIAFGATLTCLSSSFEQTIWSLVPLLAPALVIIEGGGGSLPASEIMRVEDSGYMSGSRTKVVSLCAYAGLTMIGLSRAEPLDNFRLKLCWLFGQLILYWGLSHGTPQINRLKSGVFAEVINTAMKLSYLIVVTTAPLTFLWWQGIPSLAAVGVVGALKACRWMAILFMTFESRASDAAWATIFAVCNNAIWTYPHEWQASLTLLGAFAALYRVASTFANSSAGKWILLSFVLCPLWPFLTQSSLRSRVTKLPGITPSQLSVPHWTSPHHPIWDLAEQGSAKFQNIQRQQSQSFLDAVAEYNRRYGRVPPPGFDKWYSFAIANDVQWIDEYDLLTNSFEPYWRIPPTVLKDYVDQAIAMGDDARLNTLLIKNHTASLSRGSFQHAQLIKLIQPILENLPDLKALLNEPDEPRILIPYDISHENIEVLDTQPQSIQFTNQDRQNVWDTITLPCAPDSAARSAVIKPKPKSPRPSFVSSVEESRDICLKSTTFSKKHGFLSSPSTFFYTHSFVPIMSTARFSTFQDIMIPSSYYFQDDISSFDEARDLPWEQKQDFVYWRGSGTGGHWSGGSWRMGHRQRFVNFTNSAGAEILLLEESSPGERSVYEGTMSQLQGKFDVKFSKFIQCDPQDCEDQDAYFTRVTPDKNNDANQYKILYNLDGNSFSGRYYRFLKSNSLVFMQAMFKEWHDDRLIPWVHFVPISLTMEDLPETTRYLLDDPEGKIIAARIANTSRQWANNVLRPVDLTVAYYRAFLEYARLLDDDRAALA